MAGQYPGPFCEEAGLLSANLIHNVIEPKPEGTLKHGHIIELKKFADASKLPLTNLITWLNQIDKKTCEIKQATLSVRIKRVIETNKKLLHKKKAAGFKTSNEYQNSPFIPLTVSLSGNMTTKVNNNETCVEKSKTESEMSDPKKVTSKQDDYSELEKCVGKEPLVEELKTKNMLQYEISKQQKMLGKMKSLVSSEREQLGQLKSTKGHFSVRNVTKRDALAAKNRKLLREAQATIAKQKKLIEDIEARNIKLSQEDERLKHKLLNSCCNESNSYKQSDTHSFEHQMKKKMLENEMYVENLLTENESLRKKVSRQLSDTLRSEIKTRNQIKTLTQTVPEKQKETDQLQIENEFYLIM